MGWSCPAVWFGCTVVDYTNWDYFVLLGTEGAAVQQGEGRGRELLIHCSCLNNPITSSSPFLPKGPLSISRPAMGSLLLFSCPLRLWQQQKRVLGLVVWFFFSHQCPPPGPAESKPTTHSKHRAPALQLPLPPVYCHVQGDFGGEQKGIWRAHLSKTSWD